MPECRHCRCREAKPYSHTRGLCGMCWDDCEIALRYRQPSSDPAETIRLARLPLYEARAAAQLPLFEEPAWSVADHPGAVAESVRLPHPWPS
jgi:hypothetical protein